MKRIFKGPWVWIVLAVVGVLLAMQYLAPNGGYDEVPTSTMRREILSGNVKSITFIDGEQEIQALLDNGKKITATWVAGQQETLIADVDKQVDAGAIEDQNSQYPQPSLLVSIVATLFPFLLIILLFVFLMN